MDNLKQMYDIEIKLYGHSPDEPVQIDVVDPLTDQELQQISDVLSKKYYVKVTDLKCFSPNKRMRGYFFFNDEQSYNDFITVYQKNAKKTVNATLEYITKIVELDKNCYFEIDTNELEPHVIDKILAMYPLSVIHNNELAVVTTKESRIAVQCMNRSSIIHDEQNSIDCWTKKACEPFVRKTPIDTEKPYTEFETEQQFFNTCITPFIDFVIPDNLHRHRDYKFLWPRTKHTIPYCGITYLKN